MSRRVTRPGLTTMTTDVRKTKAIYVGTTGVLTFVMLFSMYKMFTPAWAHFGFPNYLRIELVIAKCLGLIALLVPGVPARLKEWAYAGFAIVLVSASIAHASSGDPVANILVPLGFLAILLTSHSYWHRQRRLHA